MWQTFILANDCLVIISRPGLALPFPADEIFQLTKANQLILILIKFSNLINLIDLVNGMVSYRCELRILFHLNFCFPNDIFIHKINLFSPAEIIHQTFPGGKRESPLPDVLSDCKPEWFRHLFFIENGNIVSITLNSNEHRKHEEIHPPNFRSQH